MIRELVTPFSDSDVETQGAAQTASPPSDSSPNAVLNGCCTTSSSHHPLHHTGSGKGGGSAHSLGASAHLRQQLSNLQYDSMSWLLVGHVARLGFRPSFVLLPEIFLALFSTAIVLAYETWDSLMPVSTAVTVALGGTTSLLLAFRLNASYSRYWEARNLWGALINGTRSLLLRICATNLAEAPHATDGAHTDSSHQPPRVSEEEEVKHVAGWCMCYAIALKHHLRGEPFEPLSHLLTPLRPVPPLRQAASDELTAASGSGQKREKPLHGLLSEEALHAIQRAPHPPLRAFLGLRTALARASRPRGMVFGMSLVGIDEKMMEALTGCERILRTPCPAGYVGVLRAVMLFWLMLLPCSLAVDMSWWTVPLVVAVGHVVISVEQLATEIENPFGDDANDLPLETYCATIEAESLWLLEELRASMPHAHS